MVIDPIFWLGLSILLVAVSITAVLVAAVPAFRELGRAARSADKLFDTLNRELPPTLEAIRLTGLEITELTDDMSQGVQNAGQVVKQVDQSITEVKQQVQKAQTTTRSMFAGVKAAWRTFSQPSPKRGVRLLPTTRNSVEIGDPRRTAELSSQPIYSPYSEPARSEFDELADQTSDSEAAHSRENRDEPLQEEAQQIRVSREMPPERSKNRPGDRSKAKDL